MTVNTNNGYHPEPPPSGSTSVNVTVTGITTRGPDGRTWGGLDIAVQNSSYRIVVAPDMIGRFAGILTEKLIEVDAMCKQANSGLIVPTFAGPVEPLRPPSA